MRIKTSIFSGYREELPAGEGYADIVYIPKKESLYPALVIELKWNETAQEAIDQIKRKKYPHSLEGYGGKILLVGISYNKSDPAGERRHTCVITEYFPFFSPWRGLSADRFL